MMTLLDKLLNIVEPIVILITSFNLANITQEQIIDLGG